LLDDSGDETYNINMTTARSDTAMLRHIDRVMDRASASIAAYRAANSRGEIVPSLEEQRRDELVARGLARAVRAKLYDAIQRGEA
jgi:hypothetical protein